MTENHPAPAGWTTTKIGSEITLQRGYDITKATQRPGRVPVVSAAGILSHHDTALFDGPGVVIGRKGNGIGRPHYVNEPYWPHDTSLFVKDFHGNHPKFVYYFFKWMFPQLNAMDVGSANPTLNRNHVHLLKILWPPLASQIRIAEILGTLDDKIELNRRMNETMEATAKRLFKSWFVDFDPVHAKAAIRRQHPTLSNADLSRRALSHMAPEIAELFPDSFEDSTLGPIPKGWIVDSIKNRTSSIQYGFTQSSSLDPIGPHFLRITDIQGGQVDWQTVPFCRATGEEIAKYRIMDGDIFVARTGASTGENIYVVDPPQAVFASYLVRFQFQHRGIARVVGEYLRSSSYFDFVAGSVGGSAQPNASAQTLAAVEMLFPSEDIAAAFHALVRPEDVMRRSNDQESDSLRTCRDKLLPRLLSGELSITAEVA